MNIFDKFFANNAWIHVSCACACVGICIENTWVCMLTFTFKHAHTTPNTHDISICHVHYTNKCILTYVSHMHILRTYIHITYAYFAHIPKI